MVVNRVVVDLSEEEEEVIGIAGDVANVEGGHPATPGSLRGNKVRWHVGNPYAKLIDNFSHKSDVTSPEAPF